MKEHTGIACWRAMGAALLAAEEDEGKTHYVQNLLRFGYSNYIAFLDRSQQALQFGT
jgi:hypothetical protein